MYYSGCLGNPDSWVVGKILSQIIPNIFIVIIITHYIIIILYCWAQHFDLKSLTLSLRDNFLHGTCTMEFPMDGLASRVSEPLLPHIVWVNEGMVY